MKTILIDIENSPNLAYCWGMWDQNIAINQLLETTQMLCYSAKWLGDKELIYDGLNKSSKKKMLRGLHKLLDEADCVIHYNGIRHDVPHINREFLEVGLLPPSPYKQIDLLVTAKRQFKFPSNKLEYVAKALGVGCKMKNSGFELWLGCMANDPNAWKEMEEYNKQDVNILEGVYYKLQPWIKGHANHSLFNVGSLVCPRCGGNHYQRRGYTYTLASKYQRYQCTSCGGWFKDNKILNKKEFKTTEIM